MGGERYFKVRGKRARQIVIDCLDHFDYDKDNGHWLFPSFVYGKNGAIPGLQVIRETTPGTFEFSYSIWSCFDDMVTAYLYAICIEIRRLLKKQGLDFHAYGSDSVGDYRRSEWEKTMRLGFFGFRENMARHKDPKVAEYYKLTIDMMNKYHPNTMARYNFLVWMLKKRLGS